MLKHSDDARKETARRLAERKWRNHDLRTRTKEEAKKAESAPKEPKELEIAETLKNEELKRGSITRAQTKFAKDIKAMLEGHANRILTYYVLSLHAKRKRLLVEKLRRLRAAQPNMENHNER